MQESFSSSSIGPVGILEGLPALRTNALCQYGPLVGVGLQSNRYTVDRDNTALPES